MKIQESSFYEKDYNMGSYATAQIHRHKYKYRKQRAIEFYEEIASQLKDIDSIIKLPFNFTMICMGTRNNWERDLFRYFLKNEIVISADISPLSQADVIGDFNKFPEDWNDKMSVIYSNALDHAPDATFTFLNWLKILKSGGIMVLGFVFNEGEGDKGLVVTEADCSSFSEDSVEEFFKAQSGVEVIATLVNYGYHHYFLKKL